MRSETHLGGEDEAGISGRSASELPADQLDDEEHRSELRDRYYGLLQELRVILPGVSVLVGFLLTAPYSDRFEEMDDPGVSIYLAALAQAVAATICCLAPAVYHRTAGRTARSARVVWAVRTTRVGLVLIAASILTAVYCVTRFVRGPVLGGCLTLGLGLLIAALWVALPVLTGRVDDRDASDDT